MDLCFILHLFLLEDFDRLGNFLQDLFWRLISPDKSVFLAKRARGLEGEDESCKTIGSENCLGDTFLRGQRVAIFHGNLLVNGYGEGALFILPRQDCCLFAIVMLWRISSSSFVDQTF